MDLIAGIHWPIVFLVLLKLPFLKPGDFGVRFR